MKIADVRNGEQLKRLFSRSSLADRFNDLYLGEWQELLDYLKDEHADESADDQEWIDGFIANSMRYERQEFLNEYSDEVLRDFDAGDYDDYYDYEDALLDATFDYVNVHMSGLFIRLDDDSVLWVQ